MSQLPGLTRDPLAFLRQQIANYKVQRTDIAAGKVFHIQPPAANATDVIQSYNPATDNAIAVITRAQSDSPRFMFHPKGLNPSQHIPSGLRSIPLLPLRHADHGPLRPGPAAHAVQFRGRSHQLSNRVREHSFSPAVTAP